MWRSAPLARNGLIFSAFQLRKFTNQKNSNKTPPCLRQEVKWGKGGGEGLPFSKALGQWTRGLGPNRRTAASGSGARGPVTQSSQQL